jgi:hypothetical protein
MITRGLVVSALVAASAAAMFAASLVRAALPPHIPVVDSTAPESRDTAGTPTPGLDERALRLAAERNPFFAHRGAAPPVEAPAEVAPPPMPETVKVLGTVVLNEKSALAMLQQQGSPPRLVRVGQTFGSWTLDRVEPGRAVLRGADGVELAVLVSRPGR